MRRGSRRLRHVPAIGAPLAVLMTVAAVVLGVVTAASAMAAATTGHVGPYKFALASSRTSAGHCTYVGTKLTRVSVKAPKAAERSAWTSTTKKQYVRYVARLQGLRGTKWVTLKSYNHATLVPPKLTQLPALPSFTGPDIKAGYSAYRVVEGLLWYNPRTNEVEGTATAALGKYYDGVRIAANCQPVPGPVTHLEAFANSSSVKLTWHNPSSKSFYGVKVRVNPQLSSSDTAPKTPSQGIGLVLSSPKATSVVLRNQPSAAVFDFSIWTYDRSHHYSKRMTVRARTFPSTPATVAGVTGVKSVTAGTSTTCVRQSNGNGACWGDNLYGELGDGTHTDRVTPKALSGIGGITSIASGYTHTCASLSSGRVACWGSNKDGELGNGTTTASLRPKLVPNLGGVVSVGAGYAHSCALTSGGSVYCWGNNADGEVGDGSTTSRVNPVKVAGLPAAKAIALGGYHTCALLKSGGVDCWGYNSDGSVGDGTTLRRTTPRAVLGVSTAVSLSAGDNFSCAVLANGSAVCWGYNFSGQLGDGSGTNRLSPVTVIGNLPPLASIATGTFTTCAVTRTGTLYCWGDDTWGQFADQGAAGVSATPRLVKGVTGVSQVAVGRDHVCAVRTNGTLTCWGSGLLGQLGNGFGY